MKLRTRLFIFLYRKAYDDIVKNYQKPRMVILCPKCQGYAKIVEERRFGAIPRTSFDDTAAVEPEHNLNIIKDHYIVCLHCGNKEKVKNPDLLLKLTGVDATAKYLVG